MLATIVDGAAVAKILAAVLVVGLGLTALYGQGALSLERISAARREHRFGAVLVNGLVVAVAVLACLAALVIGFIAMTHKS
jgi:hypothetical protein